MGHYTILELSLTGLSRKFANESRLICQRASCKRNVFSLKYKSHSLNNFINFTPRINTVLKPSLFDNKLTFTLKLQLCFFYNSLSPFFLTPSNAKDEIVRRCNNKVKKEHIQNMQVIEIIKN